MLERIAVTTDFSEASRQAFGTAVSLARRFDAQLWVVHVVPEPELLMPWSLDPGPDEESRRLEQASERLEEFVHRDPLLAGWRRVQARTLSGRDGDALERFRRAEDLELLIVASHGGTRSHTFAIGSFASQAIQRVGCPALVLRTGRPPGPAAKDFRPSRILVPTDLSPASEASVAWVRDLAAALGARMRLLHVVEAERRDREADPFRRHDAAQRVLNEARERLEQLAASGGDGPECTVRLRTGSPADVIREEAEAWPADLVAMTCRGLDAVERLCVGSVTDRTIHEVTCPVLVARREHRGERLLS